MTDDSRRDAVEPGPSVLEQLGFSVPSAPVPSPASSIPAPLSGALPPHARPQADASASVAAPSSRREAREAERHVAPAKRGKAPKAQKTKAPRARAPKRGRSNASRSPERRIRDVQKAYGTRPSSARRGSIARTIGSRILSVAAMVFAGALAVGMSVPANAFNTATTADLLDASATASMSAKAADGQTLDVSADATASSTGRDSYTVTSWAEMLRLQYGTRDYSYEMGDPNGPIRWPFPYPVPISSGFGGRAAPCYGCSSMHMGVDFTPGEGAPIYAIADGVVTIHDDSSGGYGNHVYLDHGDLLGDGTKIESLYAHMQHGSSALNVGDTVEVGDFIGTVGRTGAATGNHLHFEVLVDGVQVDPFAWLRANT